ncbi:MAG: tetratricopeptide repeat protein, partial [Planctomycetota bacterium]|jgi:tetratricopeptide (TPR) repeat protein
MSGIDIDTRSDVYSLGVLLYELLTGTTPFDARTLREAGYAEMQRIIREDEPPRPSTRLSTLADISDTARHRRIEATELPRLVRGDLDWIVMKAMDKDRGRRYETAHGLARDIERYLRDEPVWATPPSRLYKLRKFARRNRAGVLAASVALVALIGGLAATTGGFVYLSRQTAMKDEAIRKAQELEAIMFGEPLPLAIIPFEDRSGTPEEYLADGLTFSLVKELSRLSCLHVTPDASVRSAVGHLGAGASPRAIAEQLDVGWTLGGWVARDGDRLRLHVRFMAKSGEEYWRRDYDEPVGRMQAIYNAIARDITSNLPLKLTPEEQQSLAAVDEIEPEAWEAYVRGMHLIQQRTGGKALRALEHFDRALAIEPDFAAALAGRSIAYSSRMQFAAPTDIAPQARVAALQALELDDELAQAYYALGLYSYAYDWNLEDARKALSAAIDLDPNYSEAMVHYALYLLSMRRPDEALDYLDMAIEADPLAHLTNDYFLAAVFMAQRYEKTIEYARDAIDLDPDVWFPHTWLGLALAQLGRYEEAIESVTTAEKVAVAKWARDPDDPPAAIVYAAVGSTLARAGRTEEARIALDEMQRIKAERFVCPYEEATVHVALEEFDQAFDLMHAALDERAGCIPLLEVDPRLEGPFREDVRFDELLVRRSKEQGPLPVTEPAH